MSLEYLHTALITRLDEGSGALDDYGQPAVDPVATTIYSGAIDFQDISMHVRRSKVGSESLDDLMDAYFPPGLFPNDIEVDDYVAATINEVARVGRVFEVDYLEESLTVRWQS